MSLQKKVRLVTLLFLFVLVLYFLELLDDAPRTDVETSMSAANSVESHVAGHHINLPRDKRWEHAIPTDNVPEYRFSNYTLTCEDHGLEPRSSHSAPSPPQIFFISVYNGEADHLEVKLDEVYPVMDYFVIIESPFTFRGKPKPIYFAVNDTRFAKYRSKIIHHIFVPTKRERTTRMAVEKRARAEAYEAVKHIIRDGDLVLQSDLDEIPRREAMQLLRDCQIDPSKHLPAAFDLRFSYYSYEFIAGTWYAPRVLAFSTEKPLAAFHRHGDDAKGLKTIFRHGGWHCSWCFPLKGILNKLRSFSHGSLDNKKNNDPHHIKKSICEGKPFFQYVGRNTLVNVSVTPNDFPMHILRNTKQYAYLLPGDCEVKYPSSTFDALLPS